MGGNPYTSYNWADEKMQQALMRVTTGSVKEEMLRQFASGLWKFKKQFASNDDSVVNLPIEAQVDASGNTTINPKKRKKIEEGPNKKFKPRSIMPKKRDDDMDVDETAAPRSEAMMKSAQPAGPATPWSGSHMETPIIYHPPRIVTGKQIGRAHV